MSTLFITSYIISLTIALLTLIIGIFVGIKRIHTVRILPRGLRLYLMTCGFPYFFITSVCSSYIAVFYLLYNTQNHYIIEILRNVITFSSQQIRNVFTMIVIERIIATVKLEKYTMSGKLALIWRLTIISYLTSAFYLGYNIYAKSYPDSPWLYNIVHFYAFSAHVFMLTVCTILYLTNKRMYKISAYRITLKRRYTIVQNIKTLSYLFPTILIYAIFAQTGSIISIVVIAFNLQTPPVCVFHIFFNLSFSLIYFRHYWIRSGKTTTVKSLTTVKNPLGKNIPMNVTADQYFHDLRHQWK